MQTVVSVTLTWAATAPPRRHVWAAPRARTMAVVPQCAPARQAMKVYTPKSKATTCVVVNV